jgi:SNF2 family DNA or RNA helicase
MILDEAHRLKNKNTKTTTMLSQLPCVRKTLLTGTPIQNNTKELWTLLNFIEPSQFPEETSFMRDYGSLNTEEQVKGFKKMLKPYLLRRVKEDVESSIPQLSEMIIDVEMSSLQKTYYRGIL